MPFENVQEYQPFGDAIDSDEITDGTIVNADINTSAAIALSKFASTGDLGTAITIGSAYIHRVGGTDVAVADGGTGKSSWTQYLIPYADTTTSFSQIAIGDAGQVLTSNGAGSAPSFQANAALFNIIEDTTPQLGAALDCQEYDIDNVGDIIHDDATASDWTLQNIDADKDILLSINDGGSQTTVAKIVGATSTLEVVENLKISKQAYYDAEVDNGESGASKTIDWTAGNVQKITMTDNCTFSFTNPAGPGHYTLRSIQDAGGTNTYTWTGGGLSVAWNKGTEPTWTVVGDQINIHSFYFDGSAWRGDGWTQS